VRNVENIHKMMQDIREQGLFVKDFLYAIGINMLIPAFDITEEIWDKIMDINLRGYFFACQEVAKSMIQNENGGSIVGISSQHGIVANIDRTPYCTSKAGMIHLTKALALEWAKYNIRVNCVAPTFIRFEANENYLDSVMCQKQYLNQIPIHRYATPKDVANAVKFLLSEKSNMMTGQAVVLDGGWTIK
jgi:2-deoxy-D-gluconate 3-dehydrogenase